MTMTWRFPSCAALTLLALLVRSVQATDYYLDSSAPSGGNGSASLPFNQANNINIGALAHGDTIFFHPGEYARTTAFTLPFNVRFAALSGRPALGFDTDLRVGDNSQGSELSIENLDLRIGSETARRNLRIGDDSSLLFSTGAVSVVGGSFNARVSNFSVGYCNSSRTNSGVLAVSAATSPTTIDATSVYVGRGYTGSAVSGLCDFRDAVGGNLVAASVFEVGSNNSSFGRLLFGPQWRVEVGASDA